MKKKIIVSVLVCLTVCAFVFAADKTYRVTKTCKHCGTSQTAIITASSQAIAEKNGMDSIIIVHSCKAKKGVEPDISYKSHYTISSYEDNCCPAY